MRGIPAGLIAVTVAWLAIAAMIIVLAAHG